MGLLPPCEFHQKTTNKVNAIRELKISHISRRFFNVKSHKDGSIYSTGFELWWKKSLVERKACATKRKPYFSEIPIGIRNRKHNCKDRTKFSKTHKKELELRKLLIGTTSSKPKHENQR